MQEMQKKNKKTNKKTIKDMSASIQSFKLILNRQEQNSRRELLGNWIVHGYPENRNENTNQIVIETLKEKMEEETREVDLNWTHRLEAPKNNKVWPIIVKLTSYNTGSRVFKNETKLEGEKVSITDSLTKMRMKTVKKACD